MALKRRSAAFVILVLVIGALVGSAVGELIVWILPDGVVRQFFTAAVTPGIDPPLTMNLLVCTVTLGFTLKLNIIAVLGMVLMAYVMKWFM